MVRSLLIALRGLATLSRRGGRNLAIHLAAAVAVVALAIVVGASSGEWAILAICIGMVLAAEGFNTALEILCDHLHPERHQEIAAVKDIAAGAVLLVAVAAATAGACVFGPHLVRMFQVGSSMSEGISFPT